jgi:hypothetical protein
MNVIPITIPAYASNQVQHRDLCVFGLTKRLITRSNATGVTNYQSLNIAKMVSAHHSARLNSDGDPVGYVDVDQSG